MGPGWLEIEKVTAEGIADRKALDPVLHVAVRG